MRSRDTRMTRFYSILVVWALACHVQPGHAVCEGTVNAKVMFKRYERDGDFAKAALWREAAADCLKIISIPMTEIQIRYYLRHGKNRLAEMSRGELANLKKQREYHLKGAKANQQKSETDGTSSELDVERKKITQFISTWGQCYPNRFYHYGIYPSFFKVQQEIFKSKGDYAAALNLEADAADMCADQYNEITVAYFRQEAERAASEGRTKVAEACRQRAAQYEKIRDAHRRRAVLLRTLTVRKPKTWPAEAKAKNIDSPKTKTALTSQQVLRIARTDARIQKLLAAHKGVHEYAWFQGFAWFVSYYNHGWGNLGVVLVDDKTGTVLDILNLFPNPTRN